MVVGLPRSASFWLNKNEERSRRTQVRSQILLDGSAPTPSVDESMADSIRHRCSILPRLATNPRSSKHVAGRQLLPAMLTLASDT
jgi:hypothetical protein